MRKMLSVMKDNQAINAMMNKKAEIITNNEYDEAYLIAVRFILNPEIIVVVKESQYQAQLLYQSSCLFSLR